MATLRQTLFLMIVSVACLATGSDAVDVSFRETVQPFLKTHCVDCHSKETREGDLDLTADANTSDVIKNFRRWMVVLERIEAGDMPPSEADSHPTAKQRQPIIRWIRDVKDTEMRRTSGDPGIVLARRLSNAEYNYTIRDLTGVDIRPAKSFPIDPANEAGFDNSGESLAMSPALLSKYLEGARYVSEHLALTPSGIEFAPHPVVTETDRDKFCVNRIIEFYRRQRVDYAEFFMALWRYQTRADPTQTFSQCIRAEGVSPKYAGLLWEALIDEGETVGPNAALQTMWKRLPRSRTSESEAAARSQCKLMSKFVRELRSGLVPSVPNMTAPEVHKGSQPFVLWKNRKFVANRRRYSEMPVPELGVDVPPDARSAMSVPSDSVPSDDDQAKMKEALSRFCSLFPDAFFVSERARVYLDPQQEKKLTGRYLSAGFHSQMGYFRDDKPLYDLVLNEREQQELDRLWLELDFVTSAPMRQYAGFIWFDRTDSKFMRDREFDLYRAEDKDCTSEIKLRGLQQAYTAKAERTGTSKEALEAIDHFFDNMSATIRRLEKLRVDSKPVQLDALIALAGRAFRRPLLPEEQEELRAFYRSLRDGEELSHEDAIRETLVRILVSPHFCYRVDLPIGIVPDQNTSSRTESKIQPLSDIALASRLSYFLWSSMPDEELIRIAQSGRLHERDVLVGQVKRMLRDDRVKGFVTEFAGNWLDFRHFQQHNGVDRDRFPEFTDELRQAMYEEPIRFVHDVVAKDGSILDLLYADHTFVNPVLAKHYGMRSADSGGNESGWWKTEGASEFGRGGLLPMAVFLTYNSPGLRTSPVKRGNWLVKRILGEQIPAPPAAVPDLPEDETQLGDLTLRETLERHRADPSCSSCHERIDSFGLIFERYGPIGELRRSDWGGREIDDNAVFPDQSQASGHEGLRDFIRRQREKDFVDNLCRKLLAYGLNRTLQLSDEMTILTMQDQLVKEGHRFRTLIETIVTSPAFLNQRVSP